MATSPRVVLVGKASSHFNDLKKKLEDNGFIVTVSECCFKAFELVGIFIPIPPSTPIVPDLSQIAPASTPGDNETYACNLCFKDFGEHQALGGHLSGHKRRGDAIQQVTVDFVPDEASSGPLTFASSSSGTPDFALLEKSRELVTTTTSHKLDNKKNVDLVLMEYFQNGDNEADITAKTIMGFLKDAGSFDVPIVILTKPSDIIPPADLQSCLDRGAKEALVYPLTDDQILGLRSHVIDVNLTL